MQPERWRRMRALFEAAVESDRGEWADILLTHCPDDPAVRADVLLMLEADAAPPLIRDHVGLHAPELIVELAAFAADCASASQADPAADERGQEDVFIAGSCRRART